MSSKINSTPSEYTIKTHTAFDRTPYTYVLGWSCINKFYYGVRYAKNCHPSDLCVTYFSSSKYVKSTISEFGKPDIIIIRRTFASSAEARDWENKVLIRLNVIRNNLWLNLTTNKAISPECAGHSKGKTYEEIYGAEKANELRLLRSQSNSNRKWKFDKINKIHGNRNAIRSENHKKRTSTQFKELWKDINFRIEIAQSKNTHITHLSVCEFCGKLFKFRKAQKFCSRTCSNKSRYNHSN